MKKKNADIQYYALLSWNDEYMQQTLLAVNLTEGMAQDEMRKNTIARLVGLDIAKSAEMAQAMYDAAADATLDTEINELHVGDEEVSICFGTGYKERISIVLQPKICGEKLEDE